MNEPHGDQPRVTFTIPELLGQLRADLVGRMETLGKDIARMEGKQDSQMERLARLEAFKVTHDVDANSHRDIRNLIAGMEEGVSNVERYMGDSIAVQKYKVWFVGITLTAIGLGLTLVGLLLRLNHLV